jgi:diguanylate cyclase (GGDEF)-like protein
VAAGLLPVAAAFAQPSPETARFRILNDVDGLSQMSALAIAQDRQGLIWIGTQVGLNRYDGAKFRTFKRRASDPETMSEHDVSALLADPDGSLWVGTLNGLHRFDPATELVEPFLPRGGDAGSHLRERINALMFDRDGVLWIGGDDGLARYRKVPREFARYGVERGDRRVLALADDGRGGLWVGTTVGLWRFDPAGERWTEIEAAGAAATTLRGSIQALRVDRDGMLWIGTRDAGLLRLAPASGALDQWRHDPADLATLSHDRVYALLEDRAGQLWIGTEAGADLMLDRASVPRFVRFQHRAMLRGTIGAGRVVSLMQDAAGDLWFGTWSGGASLLSAVRSRFLSFEADSADPRAADAAEIVNMTPAGPDRIWLGTRRGLFQFDTTRFLLQPMPATTGYRSYAVAVDGDSLLLGTDHGVHRYDPQRERVQPVALPAAMGTPFVDFIVVEPERVWVSTRDAELFVLDRALRSVLAHHVLESRSHFLTVFDASTKVVGGDKGLYWFSADGQRVVHHLRARPGEPRALQSDTCHFFLRASDGQRWLATTAGLHRMDLADPADLASARFSVFPHGSRANSNAIKSLVEDRRGFLWLSSNAGIARFDPRRAQFTAYGAADGAIDRGYYAFVYASTPGGYIAFGGASGFTVFDPDTIVDLPPPPPPLLSELEIDHRPVEPERGRPDAVLTQPLQRSERLVLPPGRARSVGLTFASPYFSAPEQLRFAYRLDGFNDDWIETDSRRRLATYTNLAPGEYLFRVRARTADTGWAGAETRLPIVVEPFWWQTAWAKLAALLALIAAVSALFYARLGWAAHQRRLLAEQVAERTATVERAHLALEEAYARIEHLSRTDVLTGLGNRRSLDQRLPPLIGAIDRGERTADGKGRLAFFVLDADAFKGINDKYGHSIGDAVLSGLGALLNEQYRDPAFAVRWGGEEFLAIVPVADEHEALRAGERVRAAVAAARIAIGPESTLRCTISIGFACYPFDLSAPRRLDWERVVEIADTALYAAKRSGRNRVFGYVCTAPVDGDFEARLRRGPDELCKARLLELGKV